LIFSRQRQNDFTQEQELAAVEVRDAGRYQDSRLIINAGIENAAHDWRDPALQSFEVGMGIGQQGSFYRHKASSKLLDRYEYSRKRRESLSPSDPLQIIDDARKNTKNTSNSAFVLERTSDWYE
jgi:hypothetical protein